MDYLKSDIQRRDRSGAWKPNTYACKLLPYKAKHGDDEHPPKHYAQMAIFSKVWTDSVIEKMMEE